MAFEVLQITPGDGKTYPQPGQTVSMHYVGKLESGKKFDSSIDRGRPFEFVLGRGSVIRGLDEGARKISLGEKAVINITSDYAYGERGFPGFVPPNSNLIFEVEMLEFK
ncbi:hypothetical protein B9G98_02067 [Wickerhamiella sorbophila]|uniref:peptidylprolyl isomerase n=1 Tax=Wickerhamiella sorbophila TaxID=45607 RepID=A0A2T0FHL1_9ASCO|nr:hypothetical protein B9G98_02067 [Wickerhamiella sorbophila]PRT54447.1 hypothetical protein B9G98_02067 [Wickerhamiella sorbophila]